MVKNTIGQIIRNGVEKLNKNKIENPLLECQLILSNLINKDKLYIITNYDAQVSDEQVAKFNNDVAKRCEGMPLQYILGFQEFMSLKFLVNEYVLIPRSDTEVLIEEILSNVDDRNYNILEIGTGSGCISISLAKYIKNAEIFSVDISKNALKIAKNNAKLNQVEDKIKFLNGNLFDPIRQLNIFFDIIVSNPPYIPHNVIESLDINVKNYEPRLALDGGSDGLCFYREICQEANSYLKRDGMVFFEIGFDQANDVKKLLKKNNFDDINIIKDLAKRDRVVYAKKTN